MESHPGKVDRFVFIALGGEIPEPIGLERLPSFRDTYDLLLSSVGPFLSDPDAAEFADDLSELAEIHRPGLTLVYLMGHAWRENDSTNVSVLEGDETRILDGEELLERVRRMTAGSEVVLVFDCCHAASFSRYMAKIGWKPRLAVYASGEDESAIASHADSATRLALSLSRFLDKEKGTADLISVVTRVNEDLGSDGVVQGQSVDYEVYGRRIVLHAADAVRSQRGKRERSVRRIRNALLVAGGVFAAALILGSYYYFTHAVVIVDLRDLETVASAISVRVTRENPRNNISETIARETLEEGHTLRFWVPADNLIVHVEASYRDEADRAIAFHLVLQDSFNLFSKLVSLAVPPASEVRASAGKAFVPVTRWKRGRDLVDSNNPSTFWMDIRPPTVTEYLPFIKREVAGGKIDAAQTVLLESARTGRALEATGLGQVKKLGRDLGNIFEILQSAQGKGPTGGGQISVRLIDKPCDECPAPMTYEEARHFCRKRGGRLPTDLEWQFAARGVDGRIYPWGDRFEAHRANVVGLPQIGQKASKLEPVSKFESHPSPFGVVDMVGNAGDWVINVSGPYKEVFMGGTYRFNPEDSTSFLMTPAVEGMTRNEVTARCVFGLKIGGSSR